ncbi:Universal stress protein [Methanosarcina sp. MTP4]|uniref:universal stress protein n=1 Tax=Methanosarcina sp. MTP4 TaxID=1434100 RepID=UPI000615AD47|nr:universal stress protein [Methanosarcina sp. MTP4]AKB24928.1 Universal stress protein [Methanosarcina sp. MTP4]
MAGARSSTFKKIMVATDGSECSKEAVSAGIELARLSEGVVYAVYVVSTDYFSSMAVDAGWESMYEFLKKEGKETLEYVAAACKEAGVPVEPVMLEGHPAPELIDFAEDTAMDLVVMGTTGRTGLNRILLGSVAGHVVRHCKVPVMVVRRKSQPGN